MSYTKVCNRTQGINTNIMQYLRADNGDTESQSGCDVTEIGMVANEIWKVCARG